MVSRHSAHWPPTEERLAKDFVTFFNLRPFFDFKDLVQLCEGLGIEISHSSPLPNALYGFNGSYDGKRAIMICREKGHLITSEHTLLHEIRELLEHSFCDMGYPTAEGKLPESRAEEFAMQVPIAASLEFLGKLLERTKNVTSKWKRCGAIALISFGWLIYGMGRVWLPFVEDRIDKRGRALRT